MKYSINILKKSLLALIFVLIFLTPLSFSVESEVGSIKINVDTTTAYAQEEGDSWLARKVTDPLGFAIVGIGASLTSVGGKLLELSIQEYVLGFGYQINNAGFGVTVNAVWFVVRDISNLLFIFGFIFIGIRTIVDYESSSTKRMLAQLIIAALLINFSLFITKAIIEFSNLIAKEIYMALIRDGGSITEGIMSALGLTTLFRSPGSEALSELTGGGGLWFFIMSFIFLIITAFVFLNGAIMLLSRFVGLLFIMMFSPILFAANIFPQTATYAKSMWKKLISYSFYAPAYLFLILVAIIILQQLPLTGAGFSEALSANSFNSGESGNLLDSYGVILNFVVAILVIQTATSLAGKFGLAGSAIAITIADKGKSYLRRGIGAGTAGLAARGFRTTFGQIGQRVSEGSSLNEKASHKTLGGFAARQTLKVSRAAGDASFDMRNVGGVGKKLDIGEGRKGGYKTVREEIKKKEDDFADSLGTLDDTDARVKGRKKEQEQLEKELRKLRAQKDAEPNPAAKARFAEDVYEKEREISKAKRNYEHEKQRRQIGTTYKEYDSSADRVIVEDKQKEVKKKKNNLKYRWAKYQESSTLWSEEKKLSKVTEIQEVENELKILQKQERALLNKFTKFGEGYASVRESDRWWNTWIKGELSSHNKEVGKAMRKAREQGLPKEKEEK